MNTLVERGIANLERGAYWRWPARVLHLVDGDTIDMQLDLGLGITLNPAPNVSLCRIRFLGYDAPELHTKEGGDALTALSALIYPTQPVYVNSAALDKYGRILGTIDLPDGRSVINELAAQGWLRPYNGHGPKPWPQAGGAA